MLDNDIHNFLAYSNSQHHPSLILTKDEEEQNKYLKALKENQFQQVHSLSDLFNAVSAPTKVFYEINDVLPQEIYEFIEQYPTRHIGIFSEKDKKIVVVNPNYKDVSLIFVVTKENLKNIHESGMTLYDKVGLTFQN